MKTKICSVLPGDHPWQNTIYSYDSIPSTNDIAKAQAALGAPEGSTYIASRQTAGRGRMGRNFYAPEDVGVYLSVILRPGCPPQALMHLTCAVAVAMCDAVERCAEVRPGIKWTNDLILEDRKLGGILTELSVDPATGLVDWVVVGIGINCLQERFPEELQGIATSLLLSTGKAIPAWTLAAQMIQSLSSLSKDLLTCKATLMDRYRADCITLGRHIQVLRGDQKRLGKALDIDPQGGLIVAFDDGSIQTVTSGEVSIRGMYGYA